MIEPYFRRIAGMHVEDDGITGVVWLNIDPDTNVVRIHDTATFHSEPPAVIVDGIAARGRWIPMAWHKSAKDFADKLAKEGINILPDPVSDQQTAIEQSARTVLGMMKAQKLRVAGTLSGWQKEFDMFRRQGPQVPNDGFPLMSATRHAVEDIEWATSQAITRSDKVNYPKMNIV